MFLICSILISLILCAIIIFTSSIHGKYSLDHDMQGQQKFHTIPTPRIGGLAIVLTSWVMVNYGLHTHQLWAFYFFKLLIPSSVVFFAGFLEDLTKCITPSMRIAIKIVAIVIGIYLVQVINLVSHVDVTVIDYLLRFQFVSLVITFLLVLGVTNAFNIIDGYNGLCLMTFISILVVCLFIAIKVNYHFLDNPMFILLGGVVGVILWNYPLGKIFLGDGGAYFIGFIGALLLLELSQKMPNYSPLTSLLLVIYPVSETLLSIYRKVVLRHRSPFKPDRLHFHMVVYARLIHKDIPNRNAAVALKMLWLVLPQMFIALFFYEYSRIIFMSIVIYVTLYFWLYFRIISYRTPKFLLKIK